MGYTTHSGGRNVLDSYSQLEADVFYLAAHKRDFAEALSRIQAFEQEGQGPDRFRAIFLRASVLHTQGLLPEAVALYQEAYAGSTEPRLQAACCVEMTVAANHVGDFTLVDTVVGKALHLTHVSPEAAESLERIYVAYADSLYLRGDHEGAVLWYRKSLRRLEDPYVCRVPPADRSCGMAFAWYGLAKVYIALGDPVRARFAIEGIHASGARYTTRTLEALAEARFHMRTGSWAGAEAALQEAEGIAPDAELKQEVLLLWGVLHRRRGNRLGLEEVTRKLAAFPFVRYEIQRELGRLEEKEGVG